MLTHLSGIFVLRYPILFGIALILIGPLAIATPTVLGNGLLLDSLRQLVALTILTTFSGALTVFTANVISFNAPSRFAEVFSRKGSAGPSWWRRGLEAAAAVLISLSLPVSCLMYSVAHGDQLHPGSGLLAILIGLLGAYVLLSILSKLNGWICHRESRLAGLVLFDEGLIAPTSTDAPPRGGRQTRWVFPGFTDEFDGRIRLRPGHAQLGVVLLFLLVAYVGSFSLVLGYGLVTMHAAISSTPFHVVLATIVLFCFFSVAAFFFDYYRIPVVLPAVVIVWLTGAWPSSQHYYRVYETQPAVLPLEDIYRSRQLGKNTFPGTPVSRTLTVVTAPGGGIHAAAWTSRVLTGLHRQYRRINSDSFGRSLGLLSCVSGGGVGAMYYLARFEDLHSAPIERFDSLLEGINQDAQSSCLEPIAWGLAYPDLVRVLFPLDRLKYHDRGWALEDHWRRRLGDRGNDRLSDWKRRASQGRMPIVVFNATTVESGRRVLLSPVVHGDRSHVPLAARPVQWGGLRTSDGNAIDIDIVTAARLSGAFPYISPAARADRFTYSCSETPPTDLSATHLVDGGYSDNEGIVTALDYVDHLIATYEMQPPSKRPFDRILIVRIQPHPPNGTTPAGSWRPILAPLQGVLSVRQASQAERSELEVDFYARMSRLAEEIHGLRNRLGDVPELQRITRAWRDNRREPMEDAELAADWHPIAISFATVEFRLKEVRAADIPLSWRLNSTQAAWYDKAWNRFMEEDSPARRVIDDHLR